MKRKQKTMICTILICIFSIAINGNKTVKAISEEEAIKELINTFINAQFKCLSELKEIDLERYFDIRSSEGNESYNLNKEVLAYIIEYRLLQENDLKLKEYNFKLKFKTIKIKGKCAEAIVSEDSEFRFCFTKEHLSKKHNIEHKFKLIKVEDTWKIVVHESNEDEFQIIKKGISDHKNYRGTKEYYLEFIKNLEKSRNNKVRTRRNEEEYLNREKILSINNENRIKETINPYNREKAAEYAHKWSSYLNNLRNSPPWGNYDKPNGNGDCTNFISQCIHEGGIPMDYYGQEYEQWKWYSDFYNAYPKASGRVASWTGVSEFYSYCKNNSGFGMKAIVDCTWNDIYLGDIVQLGRNETDFFHSVIISGYIFENETNELKDFLISCHTTDRDNYPLSAYNYPLKRFIHIIGWSK